MVAQNMKHQSRFFSNSIVSQVCKACRWQSLSQPNQIFDGFTFAPEVSIKILNIQSHHRFLCYLEVHHTRNRWLVLLWTPLQSLLLHPFARLLKLRLQSTTFLTCTWPSTFAFKFFVLVQHRSYTHFLHSPLIFIVTRCLESNTRVLYNIHFPYTFTITRPPCS